MNIIAEVGMAHDGSLGMAHAYVDAVADAGADAVKFQCHLAEAESTPDEPWRLAPKWPQDRSRYHYWKRTEFTEWEWTALRDHAVSRGLAFLCSPFSLEAVELLDPLVNEWKVSSGEITNELLMSGIGATRKSVIVSTGMCTWDELDRAWQERDAPWSFLQCTSKYPCPPEEVGLGVMEQLRARYDARVGLSDHSGTIYPGLAAAALGADLLEVHVCFHKRQWGFDVSSSITVDDLGDLVCGVRAIKAAMKPVDKDVMAQDLAPMRELFMNKHKRKVGA